MKYLFILTILIAGNCIGQTDEAALKKAKDYLNFKITYAVLVERHKQTAVTKDQLDEVTKKMSDIVIDKVSDYNSISDLLSNNQLMGALQNITDPINKIDILQFINQTPEIAAIELTERSFEALKLNYAKIYDTIAKNKKELTENVSRYLIANSPQHSSPPQPDTGNADTTEKKKVVKKGKVQTQSYTMLNLILNIISLLGIIGLFIYFRRDNNKAREKLMEVEQFHTNNKDALTRFRKEELITSWNEKEQNGVLNMNDIENAIMNSEYFQKMGAEIQVLKKLFDQSGRGNKPTYDTQSQSIESDNRDIFYMTGPVNNYFPNSAKSMRKEETVYKFTISANKMEATFETHTGGAPVIEIVKRNETYLKPACVEENLPDLNTKNIITKKKGTAVLEGDKWVIKTKALIRYE